jgi:hypothetical protein
MPLFSTTAQLKEYFPARLTLKFEDLKPTLVQVEQEYLAEMVLGQDLYDALVDAVENNDLDPELTALLDKCRPVAAHLAVYHFTGIANVELTSGGLAVGSSDTMKPAAEWRTRDLERAVLRQGHRAMDVLINFLQANATDYDEWLDSELYLLLTTGFVRTTQQFDGVVRIGNSGYLFRQVLPALRRAESGPVADTLCSEVLVAQLQTAITDGDLDADQLRLVKFARMAAVHLAMADSIVELSLSTDERGTWTFGALLGGQTSGGPTAATDQRLQARIDQNRRLGDGYLNMLRVELQRQAVADEDHPYRSSACWVDPSAEPTDTFDKDSPVGNFL